MVWLSKVLGIENAKVPPQCHPLKSKVPFSLKTEQAMHKLANPASKFDTTKWLAWEVKQWNFCVGPALPWHLARVSHAKGSGLADCANPPSSILTACT